MNRDEILELIETSGFRKDLGQNAYIAFAENKEWKNYKGDPLSQFEDMPPHTQDGWVAFAYAASIGVPADKAWDDYYKVASGELTYSGQKHEWPYSRLTVENPKAVEAIIAALNAVKAVAMLVAGRKLSMV